MIDHIALESTFDTVLKTWATSESMAVAWEAKKFDPARVQTYVAPSLLPGKTQSPSIGDIHRRHVGIYQILVKIRPGVGTSEAKIIADKLTSLFPQGSALSILGVANGTIVFDGWPYITAGFENDGWWVVPVSVPYRADIFS